MILKIKYVISFFAFFFFECNSMHNKVLIADKIMLTEFRPKIVADTIQLGIQSILEVTNNGHAKAYFSNNAKGESTRFDFFMNNFQIDSLNYFLEKIDTTKSYWPSDIELYNGPTFLIEYYSTDGRVFEMPFLLSKDAHKLISLNDYMMRIISGAGKKDNDLDVIEQEKRVNLILRKKIF